ncbi:MAG: ATP-binding cassette domain-containing protein [Nocardioidaceae bacterium]
MATTTAVSADRDLAPLVRVDGVSVGFGHLQALTNVDLEIRPGELVALVGENGAGKSTLVRCLAGDIAPHHGQVWMAGHHMSTRPGAAARAGVEVVWQDLALCDNLDVAGNLVLGREQGGRVLSDTRMHEVARRILADLEIPIRDTTALAGFLSGGQRQMLAVARAMAGRPQLLVLDEPTASLGIHEAAQVESLIMRFHQQGMTILLVSHDIDQIFRMADRVAVMRRGQLVAELDPGRSHPDEVVGLIAGHEPDSSAHHQLSRLHGLTDELASADPSSSLTLILSTLGTALGVHKLCMHVADADHLRSVTSLGLSQEFQQRWGRLPYGVAGGPAGTAAASGQIVVHSDVHNSAAWHPYDALATAEQIASSWAVPFTGSNGLSGVITVFGSGVARPSRDELDLVTLYAGYAAAAVERDRLLREVTSHNRRLETIRDVLETLAGPVPLGQALDVALQALRRGLEADEAGLFSWRSGEPARCRAYAAEMEHDDQRSTALLEGVEAAVRDAVNDGRAAAVTLSGRGWQLAVKFSESGVVHALVARGAVGSAAAESCSLIEDAAHSITLALEREKAQAAQQEANALRRTQQLQQDFLARLSHDLRTPLTAIRGYA